VLGDLARPGLGISPERFAQLADSCDAVYHNASVISVMRGYTSLRGVNVHGTRELVRLACIRGIPLHYLSTLNVAPPSGIAAEVPEDFLPAHAGLQDGYQQSKWAAERLVQQAAERGLPVSVYRLARLVGSPESGYVNPADLLWRVLLAGIPIGAIPRLYRADAWTPVDFVADAVVHLAQNAATGVFNLVPYPELPLTDLCAWINDYGYRVTLEPLPRWRSLLPDTASDLATTAFFDLWSGGEGTVDLEIGTVATANLDAALAGTRIVCPRPDATMMRRYLDHCVREELLPEPGGDR
jgi:nonribosomal peptide synthetase MxcG